MDLAVAKSLANSKMAVAGLVSLAGLGCNLYSLNILKKEYVAYTDAKRFGREYHPDMNNMKKLVTFFMAGVVCSLSSKAIRLDANKMIIKAQDEYIEKLMGDMHIAAEDYEHLHTKWCRALELANDITEAASLNMNESHYGKFSSDMAKLSHKYDGSGIVFNGTPTYNAARDAATRTLENIF